ncbi:uncharacterized protein LOC111364494 isoform X1 [Spodoptera litura]|uniref:Uncharacterized protein LOC111364494 isoform X1 n=1 Tax=Spodoptera litura TaxID=69820 RepID=A0A9J7J2I3_SPOLT|nr:uncharacterized protein LOC111364494 isoform X1 [Spodoptera litura]XP_022837174.1 uncharacterized protein LOC111364494 isoform X1 [Spodoptera litura]XP_022837175.1 uncharacterized protein LOC111364494 isoform X1 [Spodoptera litura]
MLEKNKTWLEGADLEFKVAFHRPQASTSAPLKLHPGRPPIDFENASEKTKKRCVEDLVSERSASELTLAAEIAHRKAGYRNVAKAIRSSNNPAKGNQSTSESCVGGRQLSSDEALAYYIDSKCTTHSYKQTRKWSMKAGHRVPVKRLNKLPAEVLDMIIPPSQPPLQVPSNLDHTDENYLIPDSSESECESD